MLTNLPRYCVAICVLASVAQSTRAADLLPADRPIAEVIDHYTDGKLKAAGVTPAPQADDATIVRRLMLDLAGRIPTAAEAQQYVALTDPQKRSQLVDRLIDSPWFVRHSATQYNLMLRGVDGTGPDLRRYLLAALGKNRPWNRMVRELLGGLPEDAADTLRPDQFVLKRLNSRDVLTRDVSSMFFGINITCCQCHTHPYVDTLSQDYFFGMKAFFSRSYEFQGKLFEKRFAPSKVKFKNNDGEEREVGLMFLTGTVVETPDAAVPDLNKAIGEENKLIGELNKNFGKDKKFPPAADFSPRGQLVKVAELPEGQRLIARSIVNRLWFRFYGHALVMRVDQMHEENSPSHPELLDWLSRDFIAHGWDLRRLTRGLVSSQAYSRSSRWPESTPPRKDLFAVAELRPLTPMQFGMSVLMLGSSDFAAPQDADAMTKKIEGLERSAGGTFGSIIDRPQLGLQINVNEPLGMSNDPGRIRAITSRIVPQLMKLDDPNDPHYNEESVLPPGSAGWKYVAAAGLSGDDWLRPDFDDSSWKAARTPAGYGQPFIAEKQGTTLDLKEQDIAFRREFQLDGARLAAGNSFKLRIASDDSAAVWINGKLVDDEKAVHDAVYWNRDLKLPDGVLVNGRNVVAVRLRNAKASPDAVLDLQIAWTNPDPQVKRDKLKAKLNKQIDLAVWSVLSRPPTSQEVELLARYLADHSTLSADERARIEQAAAAHRAEIKRTEGRAAEIEAELKALDDAESVLPPGSAGWKYAATAGLSGDDWLRPDFDDGAWTTARTPAGYGQPFIAEKGGTTLELKQQDIAFRREFQLDGSRLAVGKGFKLRIASDDSAAVWINGKLIDDEKAVHDAVYWNRDIELPGGSLVAGRNVVAVLLRNAKGSPDAVLDLQIAQPDPDALVKREKLNSQLNETRKLAATPAPAVPTDADLARKAREHMVWALVAGPEFRFNH